MRRRMCAMGRRGLWVDAIIDPAKTRAVLMTALEACAMNPEVGVQSGSAADVARDCCG
jgi:acetyl-CoA carboxylase carboxyltransferase component